MSVKRKVKVKALAEEALRLIDFAPVTRHGDQLILSRIGGLLAAAQSEVLDWEEANERMAEG